MEVTNAKSLVQVILQLIADTFLFGSRIHVINNLPVLEWFCFSFVGSTLKTCINNKFDGCKQDAKSVKLFKDKGDNLVNAYANLCANELKGILLSVRFGTPYSMFKPKTINIKRSKALLPLNLCL